MDTQDHAIYHVWIHFIPTSLYPRREKTIWSELESNPGPLISQATALTTRPWLLGQYKLVASRESDLLSSVKSPPGLENGYEALKGIRTIIE